MSRRWAPVAATLLAIAAPSALGGPEDTTEWQFRSAYPDHEFLTTLRPLFLPRELDLLADGLEMDEDQRAALAALADASESAFETEWLAAAERKSDLDHVLVWDDPGNTRKEEGLELAIHVDREREIGRRRVLEDLELLLTVEQRARLPLAMRDFRRRAMLAPGALLRGESIDLVATASVLELNERTRAEVDTILDEYADQLDAALVARIAATRKLHDVVCEYAIQDAVGFADVGREELYERLSETGRPMLAASERVRAINEQYARRITPHLEGETRERFEALIANAPPNSEREPRALRALRLAENVGTLAGAMSAWGSMDADANGGWTAFFARRAEPLTRDQGERIDELRRGFERAYDGLLIKHNLQRFADLPDRAVWIDLGEFYAYFERRLPDGPSSYDGVPMAFHSEVANLSAETIKQLRKILTVRQRVLLMSADY